MTADNMRREGGRGWPLASPAEKREAETWLTIKKSFTAYRDTGIGEVGCPRPGAEGIERVPSASSSDDRGREQVLSQACSSAYASGSRGSAETARECMEGMHLSGDGEPLGGMVSAEEGKTLQEDETDIVNDVGDGLRRLRLQEEEPSYVYRWERNNGGDNETACPPSSSQ